MSPTNEPLGPLLPLNPPKYLPKTNMRMETPPFEDVFSIKKQAFFPACFNVMLLFRGVSQIAFSLLMQTLPAVQGVVDDGYCFQR